MKKACYRYEEYRELWELLRKSRQELLVCGGASMSQECGLKGGRMGEFECPILARYLREQLAGNDRLRHD